MFLLLGLVRFVTLLVVFVVVNEPHHLKEGEFVIYICVVRPAVSLSQVCCDES